MGKDIKKNKEKYKNDDKDKTSSTTKKRLSKKRLLILVLIILIIISPIVLLTVAHFSKIKESENSVKKEKKNITENLSPNPWCLKLIQRVEKSSNVIWSLKRFSMHV